MSESAGGRRWWRVGPRTFFAIVIVLSFVVFRVAAVALLREFGERDGERAPRFVPGMKLTPAPGEEAEEGREPGRASARARERFAKSLGLTPAQAASVDSISLHEFAAVSAIREETWPRIQTVLDDTRRRIDSVLTPAQRTRYHDILARQEERWKQEQTEHDSGAAAAATKKP